MEVRPNPLVAAALAGDEAAAGKLIAEYHARIFAFLRRLAGNDADAEDLTQRTFARVWTALDRFAGRSSLSSWMHGIAYHVYLDWRRAERRGEPQKPNCAWIPETHWRTSRWNWSASTANGDSASSNRPTHPFLWRVELRESPFSASNALVHTNGRRGKPTRSTLPTFPLATPHAPRDHSGTRIPHLRNLTPTGRASQAPIPGGSFQNASPSLLPPATFPTPVPAV